MTSLGVSSAHARPCRSNSARSQKRSTEIEVVADEHDRLPFAPQCPRRSQSTSLEALVTDSKHLVEQKDVEVDLDRDRVREPEQHAGGVVLQLLVDEALEARERDDVVEPLVQLAAAGRAAFR